MTHLMTVGSSGHLADPVIVTPTATQTVGANLTSIPSTSSPLVLPPGASEPLSQEIVFVDPGVPDYQILLDGIGRNLKVVILDAKKDGIAQITDVLAGQENLSAIHIISHGGPGSLQLGSTSISSDTLPDYSENLQGWARALTQDADILLYGCDVASGARGDAFIHQLSQLTGADFAASVGKTGDVRLGGDWVLEEQTGVVEAGLIVTPEVGVGYHHLLGSSSVNLSTLDGSTGFRLDGVTTEDNSGLSVSAAGDVNGDGFDDLIIGARFADPNGLSSGSSYVVFGKASGFNSTLNLSTLDGSIGFRLDGVTVVDQSGESVSSAGDVNGDGYDDLIVGAHGADPNGLLTSGSSYVVFGKASGFNSTLNLSTLDGSTGFRLDGVTASDAAGVVGSAGDVNGDGLDDLIVGAYAATPNGSGSGASYVIFGKSSGFNATINLSTLNGSTGFRLDGVAERDHASFVSSAGDINGDGYDDLIVGAHGADPNGIESGASYVVFGKSTAFTSTINLSSLNGSTGFRLDGVAAGDVAGRSVSSAGDVNGDGFDDLIIGAHGAAPNGSGSGASYVVFGKSTAFISTINLSTLDGSTGFRLDGVVAGDSLGRSVSSAGDVNGDGFDDLIVGAYMADPNGTTSGSSYVVFGKVSGFNSAINLSSLDGSSGFRLDGVAADDGSGRSVSSAGDVNGDGFDDLIVGAFNADPNGSMSGASYIIFGSNFTNSVTFLGTSGADTLSAGTSAAERFVSGGGNDTMTGGGGADLFHGGGGDDTITISDLTFQLVDGGSGTDTLALSGTGINLNLTTLRGKMEGIEAIDITGSGNNTLTLTALDLLNLSDSSNTLTVNLNTGDTVDKGTGWTQGMDQTVSGVTYNTFTQGQAVLRVAAVANAVPPASAINLSSLNGSTGFRLDGVAENNWSGGSVSSAGDVNGDGFDDLIVGAQNADPNGSQSGASYVVFGKASGFSSAINFSSLDGSSGFRLDAVAVGDFSGFSVSSAGDVNGDGFADLIVGAFGADPNGSQSGASYVVFGKASGFSSVINLSTLNGSIGFRLNGVAYYDRSGFSVSSAGDVNGDGFDDLIVGAYKADPNGSQSGASYVVFGKASGFSSVINLSTLNGSSGFRLDGVAASDSSGQSVSSAGDVNGDGFGDLIVGAIQADPNGLNSGASYVVFGKSSGFISTINLSSLDGSTGFRLNGVGENGWSGESVSAAGDVNGDGFDDLIVGAGGAMIGSLSGSSYVVFGKTSNFSSAINLSSLDGNTGFRLDGVAASDWSGHSVSSAGDVNGDGFDDLIVGASNADPNGSQSGTSYVVFGKASGFSSVINLSTLNGSSGFRLDGVAASDSSGQSVSSAGDVNGDGFDDLIVGAQNADPNGNASGSSYIIFGSNSTNSVTFLGTSGADTLSAGSSAAERFVSGGGNDTITGGGGADVFHGGAGNDTITVSDLTFQLVDGGSGTDTLALAGAGITLTLASLRGKIEEIETINLTGSGNNTLVLTALDVLNVSDSSNTLTVDGNAGDVVNAGVGWMETGGTGGYRVFTQGQAAIQVATAVSWVPQSVIPLSSLNGSTGFRLDGVAADDRSGSVSSAGDVNGDGFDDLIVGAYNRGNNFGSSYVVFGKSSGFLSNINLSLLDGSTGFRLDGAASVDQSGRSVSSAGDVNGDGFDDLIVGAHGASNINHDAGASYVVFGKSSAFASAINLSSLNGSSGFRLDGVAALDQSGYSVSSAGDVNGDGFTDLIVGANLADPNGSYSGSSYVVFGKASGFSSAINLSSLDGSNGFRLDGVAAGDWSGWRVNSAGDVNADGFDDLIVGSRANQFTIQISSSNSTTYWAGASYVVFGKSSAFTSAINLSSLNGSSGFRLDGSKYDEAGHSVSSAGDVNGDGFDDLIIGAPGVDPNNSNDTGSSYVVFGRTSGFNSAINLSTLDGSTGFRLDGVGDTALGSSVSSAGDVNGDGFDDLIVGQTHADSCYVVFGKLSGFNSVIDLSSLNGNTGFRLDVGEKYLDVHSIGDINGDGFDDLIIGAKFSDPNSGLNAGSTFVIFGNNSTSSVTFLGSSGSDTLHAGTSAAERFVSGGGNDSMIGGGGADVFHGGEGDDNIIVSDLTFQLVDGGSGTDTLAFSGSGMNLNLSSLRGKIESIETINITGGGNNTLTLTALDVLNLSDSSNTLTVNLNVGDTVSKGTGWTQGTDQLIYGVTYNTYTQGQAILRMVGFASYTSSQIAALANTQLDSLTSVDLSMFVVTQLDGLSSIQLTSLADTQLNGLFSGQLTAMAITQMNGLTSNQIAAFADTQLDGLTSTQLATLANTQLDSLTSIQLMSLTATQLDGLTSTQLIALANTQLDGLRSADLSGLANTQLDGLASTQLKAMANTQLDGLTSMGLFSLANTQLDGLYSVQLASLANTQLDRLTSVGLTGLANTQLNGLSSAQLASLVSTQLDGLTSVGMAGLANTQLDGLTSVHLTAMSNTQLDGLISVGLSGLANTQLDGLTSVHLTAMSNTQLDGLTSVGLSSLANTQLDSLTSVQLSTLSNTQLNGLTSTQLAAFVNTQLDGLTSLGMSGLANTQLDGLTSVHLTAMSNTQLDGLTSVGLAGLANTQLDGLSSTQLVSLANTQLDGLSSTQLAGLANSQLDGISSTQLASLANTQFDGFTSTQLAAVANTQLDGLSSAQLTLLANTQLDGLSSAKLASLANTQLDGLTTIGLSGLANTQLDGLTSTQLSGLANAQLGGLTSAQLTALANTQLAGLRSEQLANLTTTQLDGLLSNQIGFFTTTQIIGLNSTQIDSLIETQTDGLTETQLNTLTPTQINGLLSSDKKLTQKRITALTTTQVMALTTTQIASLNNGQVNGFTSTQIVVFTTTQLGALASDKIGKLSMEQIDGLSSVHVASLTTTQLAGLSEKHVTSLTTTQLDGLSNEQIVALTTKQLGGLRIIQVESLTTTQMQGLNAAQVAALPKVLTTGEAKKLTSTQIAGLTLGEIGSLGSSEVKSLTAKQIAGLSAEQLSGLSPEQTTILTTDQIRVLNSTQLGGLSPDQISALNTTQVKSLTSGQIAGLSKTQVSGLESTDIAVLSANQVKSLSSGLIAALTVTQIGALSSKQLTGLSTVQVQGMDVAQVGALSTSQVQGLNKKLINVLSTTQMSGFASTAISALSVEQMKGLSTTQMGSLSTTQLDGLTTTQVKSMSTALLVSLTTAQLNSLSTDQLVAVSASQLSKLTTNQVSSMATTALAALTTNQVKGLSTSQLSGLSTVQVSSMESSDIAALSVAQFKGFDSAQIGSLTTIQITGLGTSVVRGLSTTQVSGLESSDIGAMNTSQVRVLSSKQLTVMSTTQMDGLETSQIAALSNAQLKGVTAKQIDSLSTTQMSALDSKQMNSFGSSQLLGMNVEQIGTLVSSQVKGFSARQLGAFTTTQMVAISSTNIANLSLAQARGLESTQLGALTSSQVVSFSTTGIKSLSTKQMAGLIADQISVLTTTQVAVLTTAQMRSMSATQLGGLTSAQVAALGTAQVRGFSTSQLSGLNNTQIGSMESTGLAALSVVQVKGLRVEQITALSTEQISGLTTAQVAALTTLQIGGLESADIAAFSTGQMKGLSTAQIFVLTTTQVAAIEAKKIASLSTAQVKSFTSTQIASLLSSQMTSLTTSQVKALTASQISALTSAQIHALESTDLVSLTTAQISAFTAGQIAALTETQFGNLTSMQIDALSVTQSIALGSNNIAAMTTTQVGKLTRKRIEALTTTQVLALTTTQIASFNPGQMGGFTITQIAVLTTQQLNALATDQINKLTTEQVGLGLTVTQITSLTTTQVGALTTKQITAMTITQVGGLEHTDIAAMNTMQINGLTSAQLAGFTTTQIGGLGSVQIAALTTKQEGGLTVQHIQALNSLQVSGLSAIQIKALTNEQISGLSRQIAYLSTAQVRGFETTDFGLLGATGVAAFSQDQVNALNKQQKAAYTSAGGMLT